MDLITLLRSCGALRFGEFTLASGRTSTYYVDVKRASTRPDVLGEIAQRLAAYAEDADLVAGMAVGAVPLATAVSLESGRPFLVVRKNTKEHGTGARIEGAYEEGQRVLVVEDVTTTGGSAVETVRVLRDAGLQVDTCVTVVDRGEGARKALGSVDVTLHALVGVDELLEESP